MKQKDILFLLTSVFLLVLAWIGFSIYHSAITSKVNEEIIQETTAITPDFQTSVIQDLKNRQLVDPVNAFTAVPTVTPVILQNTLENQIVPPTPELSEPVATPSVNTPIPAQSSGNNTSL